MNFFSHKQLSHIADKLVSDAYVICDIDKTLIEPLVKHVKKIQNFTTSSIGRDASKSNDPLVRSDKTLWLDESHDIDSVYLDGMNELQAYMNKELYMGLKYHEAHYAHYAKGSFYKKHMDAFKGKSSRKLTTVLYLNETWTEADGGSLCLYDERDHLLEEILPTLGRMVLFLSDRFPHEVLASNQDRYSIAGWFRID